MGGSLDGAEIRTLCNYYSNPDALTTFVETGTYHGDTTVVASGMFRHVYTMEIDTVLYGANQQRFAEHTNIHAYLGDSVEILSMVPMEEPCVWFLDAHQSGTDTSNNGREHVPVLSELAVIFPPDTTRTGLVIVDDVRLFKRYWDWEHVTLPSIDAVLRHCNVTRKFVRNDRYVLVIEKK